MTKFRRSLHYFLVFIVAACVWALPLNAKPLCGAGNGDHVVLAADTVDPDVFLWDSRFRLIAYVAGDWKSTREVLSHTILIAPGTLAVVTSCRSGEARPKYSATREDVVGVRILTGVHRNFWGWVASDDIHLMRPLRR